MKEVSWLQNIKRFSLETIIIPGGGKAKKSVGKHIICSATSSGRVVVSNEQL